MNMKEPKRIVIAVDGYSSTGKSTLAKHLAKELGYVYVDTGAMYRAVTLFAMEMGFISDKHFDEHQLIEHLDQVHMRFKLNPSKGFAEMYLNGINVETRIRSIEVSNLVSQVSKVSEVRQKLVELQQKMARDRGIVMDGRDIGTVVFPNAELKLFMTASPEKRAQRRFKEMTDDGIDIAYETVLENVNKRDRIDTTREDSPLVKADDAIELDNSNLDVHQTYELAMRYVEKALDNGA